MKKRILIFALAIFTLLTLTSCGKKFTVTFNADGGTLTGEATVQVKKGKTVSEPAAPTRNGYTFAGWYNGETKYDFSSKVTSDITLVAHWTEKTDFKDPVTITFDSDGGSSVKTITVEKGSKATRPANPTKSGYTFAGWYNGETLFDFDTAITANITLVAKWTKGGDITNPVTITFDSNGGSEIPPLTIQKATIPTRPADPVKKGFVFDYWHEDGKTAKFNFGNKLQRNIKLVAAWREYAIVTIDLNLGKFEVEPGAEEIKLSYEVSYDENIPINNVVPTRNGFEFGGWMINGEVVDLTTYKVTADVTITAKWNQIEGKEYVTVTFDSNGGTVEFEPIVLLKGSVISNIEKYNPGKNADGDKFDGWKLNGEYFGATTVVDQDITLVASWDSGQQTSEYKSKWEPNKQTGGFNGKGMTVKILCLPTASFDPFDPGYSSSDKKIKQTHQRLVEKEYNISIVYEAWGDSASWGPDRVSYIKTNAKGEFRANDVYIVNITSSWIPTLVKEECLAELYDMGSDTGIFKEIGYQEVSKGVYQPGTYEQNDTINQATASSNKVYGYVQGNIHPDHFMYFNEDLISESGLENPAELWFKGEWTWSKFEEYTKQLQNYLNGKSTNNEKYYALALGYPEFWVGSCASTGNGIATASAGGSGRLNLISPNVVDRLSAIQTLVKSGSYDDTRGVYDVAPSFAQGKVAFHHGDLWFLKDPSRFDPTWSWKIGCVPYPTANDQGGEPQYTTDANKAIKKADGTALQDASGQYISGVDMSNSSFKVPYTTTSCYSVIDMGASGGKNGINNKIVFAIMYDLFSGQGSDPKAAQITDEQAYRNWLLTKIGKELYADVIMSVQDCTYYELIDTLSMTVGGGSHFTGDGLWAVLPGVCKSGESAQVALSSIYDSYKKQFGDLGYIVA